MSTKSDIKTFSVYLVALIFVVVLCLWMLWDNNYRAELYEQEISVYCEKVCEKTNCTSFDYSDYDDKTSKFFGVCRLSFCPIENVCETRDFVVRV